MPNQTDRENSPPPVGNEVVFIPQAAAGFDYLILVCDSAHATPPPIVRIEAADLT